jgi:phage recombination protein Bet
MPTTGITREEADRLKHNVLARDGGYTNANAAELKAIELLVTDEVLSGEAMTMTRAEENKIREEAGLANMTATAKLISDTLDTHVDEILESMKPDVPVHVVTVPQSKTSQEIASPIHFDEAAMSLIKAKVAPNATNTEFELLMYLSRKYNLDPILKQIWLVKFGDAPAQIYAGRDGYLEIAHRSGHFDGMKSWVEYEEDPKEGRVPVRGKCIVYRNDMTHPIESEVLFKEYTTKKNLWQTKPSVMLIKVAESVCLRKAFRVSGLYDPDEMGA